MVDSLRLGKNVEKKNLMTWGLSVGLFLKSLVSEMHMWRDAFAWTANRWAMRGRGQSEKEGTDDEASSARCFVLIGMRGGRDTIVT